MEICWPFAIFERFVYLMTQSAMAYFSHKAECLKVPGDQSDKIRSPGSGRSYELGTR